MFIPYLFPPIIHLILYACPTGRRQCGGGSFNESFPQWLGQAGLDSVSEEMLPKLKVWLPLWARLSANALSSIKNNTHLTNTCMPPPPPFVQLLYDQACEGGQLKATLNAMKESELQLAAQEAAENARHVELLVSVAL